MKYLVYLFLLIGLIACTERNQFTESNLEKTFMSSDNSAKPWVYWYWMNGNVTKEGITADVKAMEEIGIGGAFLMTIGGPVERHGLDSIYNQLSPGWWKLIEHAFSEAERRGIQLGMAACDGWATAGGPQIKPKDAMKKVVWNLTSIEGGKQVNENIPIPFLYSGRYQTFGEELEGDRKFYRDIACYALPAIEGVVKTMSDYSFKASSNIPGIDAGKLFDGNLRETAVNTKDNGYIQIEFKEPFACRSVRLFYPHDRGFGYPFYAARMKVLFSNDGNRFISLGRFEPDQHGWQDDACPVTFRIPETRAKFYRFIYDTDTTIPVTMRYVGAVRKYLSLSEIELSPVPWIDHFEAKAAYSYRVSPPMNPGINYNGFLPINGIINVTQYLDSAGVLRWNAPNGKWTMLRMGYTLTAMENGTGGGGRGLESDKFSKEATRLAFDGWLGEVIKRVGRDKTGNVFSLMHVDSWEATTQNWTDNFIDEFAIHRGYDPLPYLPALAGFPLESPEVYENFLSDFRLTIAELLNDNFYGEMVTIAHQNGCEFSAEATGQVMTSDCMLHYKYVDRPMGEFWRDESPPQDKPEDVLEAVSGAHVYNHQIVQSEAFTDIDSKWYEHPFGLKSQGDYNFCKGINKLFIHVFVQQPFVDKKPGFTLDGIGLHFNRGQTWWKQTKPWIDYLTTCQSMLQEGYQVADLLYFTGMEIPRRGGLLQDQLKPGIPEGYHYLSINPDALLNQVTIENELIKLPNGATHKVLVLPDDPFLGNSKYTTEVLKKIEELVKSGVILVGPKPTDALGLKNYQTHKKEVLDLSHSLWGNCNGLDITSNHYGKGRVYWGESLEDILSKEKIYPDLICSGVDSIEFIHKKSGSTDFYFISNQKAVSMEVSLSFRINNKVPEIWNPLTKVKQSSMAYENKDGRTNLTLSLEPFESLFVVFNRDARKDAHLASLTFNSKPVKTAANANWNNTCIFNHNNEVFLQAIQPGNYNIELSDGKKKNIIIKDQLNDFSLKGSWKISFEEKKGLEKDFIIQTDTLFSLTKHSNPNVKHFSGTSVYELSFDFPGRSSESGIKYDLDLGEVANIARVYLNGKDMGYVWTKPYRIEIADALINGQNKLIVEVTNTWNNRIVRDMELPYEQRISYFPHYEEYRKAGDLNHYLIRSVNKNLRETGLIGPCSIKLRKIIPI